METDVIILGAGAAGMMCALQAGQRGRRVVVLDHARKLAEKIRISGGGRCNFTHLHAGPDNFISDNPHFCRSALARYTPQDFVGLMHKHGLGYHEKAPGQLFCDEGSGAIIEMLKAECDQAGVQFVMPCEIVSVRHQDGFQVMTAQGSFEAPALVVATGGLSIPKIGASPLGYKIAEQFGLPMVKPKPGLVPLSVAPEPWAPYAELAGIALNATVRCGKREFRGDLLFTHRGLSGPAILQISSYWSHGERLHIDMLPGIDVLALLQAQSGSQKQLANWLTQWWPKHLAEIWCAQQGGSRPLNQYNDKQRSEIAAGLHDWQILPSGTLGYAKAEVTCGGVDTRALSSKTMSCNAFPGLYFIGEVLDVTGQLGGYNFQWAWASGYAAGMSV
ncbi:MAG: NAD(P)/FAD-dependent oxidoreductase [Gallionella sp.]|nr:NAD(P)/FAD-dependent oxidoreductase [Gallionella sp.]